MTDPIEIQTGDDPTLKLIFDCGPDRWSHRWIGQSADSRFDIMTSVEGKPDQAWPSSPPLQDVSLHALEQGSAILCVGMAGKSHWSASYSVERATAPAGTLVQSDLACLQKEFSNMAVLGSNYKLDQNCQVHSVSQERVELSSAAGLIVLDTIGDTEFKMAAGNLIVRPTKPSLKTNVATRWGFRIKIAAAK